MAGGALGGGACLIECWARSPGHTSQQYCWNGPYRQSFAPGVAGGEPKSWNTNGLGMRVVAGGDLQCVIFASPRAY
jgi:hypothetical protein